MSDTASLLDLGGRVGVVTGASGGIGSAIATTLASAGAAVVVHGRRTSALAALTRQLQAEGARARAVDSPLSTRGDADRLVGAAVDAFGRMDILVNAAGSYPERPLGDLTLEEWRSVFAANVETALLCTQAAAGAMRQGNGGAVVNVGSIAGIVPAPAQAHYSSAKAALLALTRASAQELGPMGIRVNAVSPGLVERPGIEQDWPDGVARWQRQAPLSRLGTPKDVANAVLFLASPAAAWVTGHDLVVDGGVLASPLY